MMIFGFGQDFLKYCDLLIFNMKFANCEILLADSTQRAKTITVPDFVKIGQSVAELL